MKLYGMFHQKNEMGSLPSNSVSISFTNKNADVYNIKEDHFVFGLLL
jgi:hypothetical protein